MTDEPILEYLTAQLQSYDQPPESFTLNQFRSLDPNPPQGQEAMRDLGNEKWRVFLRMDEEIEELYAQLQRARRLCNELEIAKEIITAKAIKSDVY
jgi:hypothetical protein